MDYYREEEKKQKVKRKIGLTILLTILIIILVVVGSCIIVLKTMPDSIGAYYLRDLIEYFSG